MATYGKNGDFLICGDFNARVGTNSDCIIQDDSKFLPLGDSYTTDKKILNRRNKDLKIDKRGRDLLDFCIGHQLRILNGRILGDLLGNYTCYTPNGCSTVDYAIVSENVLESILYFKVNNFLPTLSDCHCPIEWQMSASFMESVAKTETTKNSFPLRYIWSDDSAHAFQQALASNKIQSFVSEFVSITSMNDDNSINTASEKLGNIFSQAAEMSLKKQKPRNKNKPKNPKWFNGNLQQLRQNLFSYGKVYTKYPKDPAVKNNFYKLYREYNKIRKSEKKSFRQNLLKELETLHDDNPKTYWQLINELQGKSQNQDGNCISASD